MKYIVEVNDWIYAECLSVKRAIDEAWKATDEYPEALVTIHELKEE